MMRTDTKAHSCTPDLQAESASSAKTLGHHALGHARTRKSENAGNELELDMASTHNGSRSRQA